VYGLSGTGGSKSFVVAGLVMALSLVLAGHGGGARWRRRSGGAVDRRGQRRLQHAQPQVPDKLPLADLPGERGYLPGLDRFLVVARVDRRDSVPLGLGAAVYLEEYAQDTRINRMIEINISNPLPATFVVTVDR
jgi:hypothetical protein